MNEEFAATLKLVIDESSIAKVKERLKQLKKELSTTVNVSLGMSGGTSATSVDIKPKVDMTEAINSVKDYEAQIEQALRKLGDLSTTLSEMTPGSNEYVDMAAQIEKINNKINSLILKQKKLTEETKKTDLSMKQVSSSISKATSGAKSFVTALIGARSAYFAIRKAMSTYLSQNDALQSKLNACWYALGSLFAPVLERIISLFATLIGYVNVFLRSLGLAGINMKNYGNSASSAAKKTKQLQVSGIDEINNVGSNDSSGGASGGSDIANPFDNLQLDSGIMATLEAIGAWCSANLPLIAGLVLGITAAILALKAGLDLVTALGIGVLVAGLVITIGYLLQYLNDPSWSNFGGIVAGIGVALLGLAIIIGSTTVAVAGAIVLVLGLLASFWDSILEWANNLESGIDEFLGYVQEMFGSGIASAVAIVYDLVKYLVKIVVSLLNGLFVGVKQIIDGIIQICRGDLKGGLTTILKGLLNIIIGLCNAAIDAVEEIINIVIDGINVVLGGISDIASAVGELIGLGPVDITLSKVHFGRLASLDTGTNYVPNDMLAQIHQGEAVIPKKFNSQDFFGQTSAEELNLLSAINSQLEELNKKDTTINLDGENVAQVIDNRIQSIRQRQGTRVFALAR